MKLSARNQLTGKVVDIKKGMVTAKVSIDIGDGKIITSVITIDALDDLALVIGSEATAVIKSTSIMLMV